MNAARIEQAKWYWRRIRSMSVMEVLHRIGETWRRRRGKRLGGKGKFVLAEGQLPVFTFSEDHFAELAEVCVDDWESIWERAQTGNWNFLGAQWPIMGKPLEYDLWSRDPISRSSWPTGVYCFDIPYRHVHGFGDIKYIWEVNRLQFLPPIAALAKYRDDENMGSWCLECLERWFEANPPFENLVYASGIELAARIVSVILTVSFVGRSKIPHETTTRLREFLHAHAFWIYRFPSKFSSANNHLISEAAALYLVGSLMPDLPAASRYKEYGKKTLIAESQKQFLADGVGAEQSPTYTAFSLEWYAMCCSVSRELSDDLHDNVLGRMYEASDFLRWITDLNGHFPRFGDDDEGRVVLSCMPSEENYVSSITNLFLRHNRASQRQPGHLRDLFALPDDKKIPVAEPQGQRVFQDGGYTVLRQTVSGRDIMLVADHGPLGYLSIAAHGHADALAVWLHVDQIPIFVDAGTYLYHSGGAERDYFRGTAAHNTLIINKEDQSHISGAFNWAKKANAWSNRVEGFVTVMFHDGYYSRHGVLHQRSIEMLEDSIISIRDRLVGKLASLQAEICMRFLVSPSISCSKIADAEFRFESKALAGGPIDVKFEGKDFNCSLEDAPISLQFGKKILTKCIVVQSTADRVCEFDLATRILLLPQH